MKLASIECIQNITPHNNADNLVIAQILNWKCIIKKGLHKKGDRVVYVPIDTLIPKQSWSEFLHKNTNKEYIRLKTVKLRGEISNGLILPLSVLPISAQTLDVGSDVSSFLNIKKYEKEIPQHLINVAAGPFPDHLISKTDEENGLSNPDLVNEVLTNKITVTQKLDGSSATIVVQDGKITHVCSRRLSLLEKNESDFWYAAKKITIPSNWSGIIQAELMGPSIQKNQLKLFEPELFVFNLKINENFVPFLEMEKHCRALKLQTVPLIHDNVKLDLISLQQIANKQLLPTNKPAEGIVVRSYTYSPTIEGRPLGFKIFNENYTD